MNPEASPTCYQLLQSWLVIWKAQLAGNKSQLEEAIKDHIDLLPQGNRADAKGRVKKLIFEYSHHPFAIQSVVRRITRALQRK
jgi:hypothetical protein